MDIEAGNADVCLYNRSNACNFGIAVGVIGFVMCLVFLVKDVLYVVIDFSNNLLVSWPQFQNGIFYIRILISAYHDVHTIGVPYNS